MTVLRFSISGRPRPKGRPRAVAKIRQLPGGPSEAYVQMVTPADTKEAESRVRAAFRRKYPDHRPHNGPVMLRFTAIFAIPSGWPRKLRDQAQTGKLYHTGKPDKDNIEKMIVDALNLVVWNDDSQVQGGGVKRYGGPERIDVEIELLPVNTDLAARQEKARENASKQPVLDLKPPKPKTDQNTNRSKSGSQPPADLNGFPPRTRTLIERALEREERARRK